MRDSGSKSSSSLWVTRTEEELREQLAQDNEDLSEVMTAAVPL